MTLKRSTIFSLGLADLFMKWPRCFLFWSALALALCASAGCRLDMHVQPKYTPDKPAAFFDDGRSERPEVPGTVPHGEFHGGELLYTGLIDGKPADAFPFPITAKDLDRGRSRYNIYCAPCHDYNGTGRGMIVLRGFQQPPSYHIERLRQAPAGHFFEVMTDGFGKMYSYASRISPEDRWRIAAYIRALQLSQHATLADVPADKRSQLEAQDMQPTRRSDEKAAQQKSATEKGTQDK